MTRSLGLLWAALFVVACQTKPVAPQREQAPAAPSTTSRPSASAKIEVARDGVPYATPRERALRPACAGGDLAACEGLARAFRSGEAVPRSDKERDALFAALCQAKISFGCIDAAELAILDWAYDGKGDPAAPLRTLEALCSAKEPDACELLSLYYQRGGTGPADWKKAEALIRDEITIQEARCQTGEAVACTDVVLLYFEGDGFGSLVDETKAKEAGARGLTLLTPRCAEKDAWACDRLGALYEEGQGVTRDYAKAREYDQQACSLGWPGACHSLAILQKAGNGDSPDPAAAQATSDAILPTLQRDCDEGRSLGCSLLDFFAGMQDPPDTATQRSARLRSCEHGQDEYDCYQAADFLLKEGSTDLPTILRATERACDGSPSTCTFLLAALQTHESAEARAKASALRPGTEQRLQQGCALGYAFSCQWLYDYNRNETPSRPATEAEQRALLQRARGLGQAGCDAGHGPSCEELAMLLLEQDEEGDPSARGEALRAMTRGCDLQHGSSCALLSEQYADEDRPGGPDRARAEELARRGCARGDFGGCYDLCNEFSNPAACEIVK